jgi:hypothetical protein
MRINRHARPLTQLASGIDDTIYDVSEGFFTDNSPLRIWILISNGRKNTGKFFEAFHDDKKYSTLYFSIAVATWFATIIVSSPRYL